MSPSVEERLARLEDEAQILRTLHDYGRSIDYGDEATFIDCWLGDAVLRWPLPPYEAPFAGHDELRAAFHGHTHAPSVYHKHFVLDPHVEVDGDIAHVESYYDRVDNSAEGPYIPNYGRYVDVLHRCDDGRWRFKARRVEAEGNSPNPRPGAPIGSGNSTS